VSHNQALKWLDVSVNQLTELDVSNSKALEWLGVSGNKLGFSTLRLPEEGVPIFVGSNQALTPSVSGRTISGLSAEYDDEDTKITWHRDGVKLVSGKDYTVENGIVTFLGSWGGTVYAEVTKGALSLTTTEVTINAVAPPQPSRWPLRPPSITSVVPIIGTDSIRVSWNPVLNASSYRVQFSTMAVVLGRVWRCRCRRRVARGCRQLSLYPTRRPRF